jgi:endonuclease YncB( thermonuclease family)
MARVLGLPGGRGRRSDRRARTKARVSPSLVRAAAAAGLVVLFAASALMNPQDFMADAWNEIVANVRGDSEPSMTATIAGRASVIDGDTLEIRGTRIRLNGIDAPESRQTCRDRNGAEYRCGHRAAFSLADKIGSANLACAVLDHDRYGRSVATCRLGETDVNGWMVASGWAIAYRQYSRVYIDEEAAAQAAGAGIWAGRFTPPWEWRAAQR